MHRLSIVSNDIGIDGQGTLMPPISVALILEKNVIAQHSEQKQKPS